MFINEDTGEFAGWLPGETIEYYLDPGGLGDLTNEQLHTLLKEAGHNQYALPMINYPVILPKFSAFKKYPSASDVFPEAETQRIEEHLGAAQKEQRRIIADAEREASKVREEAIARAEKQGEELLERTRHQAEDIIAKAKQQIEAHKRQMVSDAQTELAGLVTTACEKVLSDVMDQNIERRLAEKTVREF